MVKQARLELRYTRRELARLVGCSESMIVAIERCDKTPSLGLAGKLSMVLNRTVDQLFFCPKAKQIVSNKL